MLCMKGALESTLQWVIVECLKISSKKIKRWHAVPFAVFVYVFHCMHSQYCLHVAFATLWVLFVFTIDLFLCTVLWTYTMLSQGSEHTGQSPKVTLNKSQISHTAIYILYDVSSYMALIILVSECLHSFCINMHQGPAMSVNQVFRCSDMQIQTQGVCTFR